MKAIRSTLLVAGISALLSSFSLAQQTTTAPPADEFQTMVQAVESTTPSPATAAPKVGNFYSAQFGENWPPLPTDTLGVPFWDLGGGVYLLSDGAVDYAALQAEAEAAAPMFSQRQSPQPDSPPPVPPCGDGSPVSLANVVVTEITTQSWTVSFTVAGGSNGVAYSLYRATNMVAALSDPAWQWLRPVYACETVVLNETSGSAFYVVGPPPNTMVIAWGWDEYGRCDVPLGLSNVVAVAGGEDHSLALRSDGTVAAWGDNSYGQTDVPAGLSNVVGIAASWYQSAAVMSDGTVTNWGDTYGTVPDLTNAVAVSAGAFHVLALLGDGTLAAWGDDAGATVPAGLPVVKAIASGWEHNVALLADGTVTAWGIYSPGLGYTPTNVPAGLSNVTAVAAGALHSLALRSDGTVVAWGFNFNGQTNVPAGLSNVVAIAGGASFSSALRRGTTARL